MMRFESQRLFGGGFFINQPIKEKGHEYTSEAKFEDRGPPTGDTPAPTCVSGPNEKPGARANSKKAQSLSRGFGVEPGDQGSGRGMKRAPAYAGKNDGGDCLAIISGPGEQQKAGRINSQASGEQFALAAAIGQDTQGICRYEV